MDLADLRGDRNLILIRDPPITEPSNSIQALSASSAVATSTSALSPTI